MTGESARPRPAPYRASGRGFRGVTDQEKINATIARAQARARDLGRWDAPEAIIDLIAEEIPRPVFNAWAYYCATDTLDTLRVAWAASGGRGEYSGWCHDIVAALGVWVSWDLGEGRKYGLSQFGRWEIPQRPQPKTPPARLYPVDHPTHTIRVYTGGDIPEGMRWFTAAIRGLIEHVVTYDAPADIDDPAFVCPHAVAEVERMHPGHWLVYL